MTSTILTRSKLVTREIKETMEYTFFGNSMVAIHVAVVVTGVDPFKSDHYAVMPRTVFEKVTQEATKTKEDFPFRDIIIKKDHSFQWYRPTAAERKSFQELPKTHRRGNNAYEFVVAEQELWRDNSYHSKHPKKIYRAAISKPQSLVSFKSYDHTFRDIDDNLITMPVFVEYGLRSAEYLMKPMVEYLRTLDNVQMLTDETIYQDTAHREYPEIKTVPHYNAEYDGETEVKLWILPTDEQYALMKGDDKKISGTDLWNLLQIGALDLSLFKIEKND